MKKERTEEKTPDLSFWISAKFKIILLLASFAGGTLYAAALPPLNWNLLIFAALIPLLYVPVVSGWKMRFFCGWVWGLGWSFFSYNFLREIHPAVPWLLAPVISLWPAVFTLAAGWFAVKYFDREKIVKPWCFDTSLLKSTGYIFTAGILFTLIEWTRYYLFVWNDLSVTLWKIPELMQIASLTGRYGLSFLILLVNGALFALIFFKRRWSTAGIALIYPVIAQIYGIYRMKEPESYREPVTWKCALIQGDLPQQRRATAEEVFNSIVVYATMSLPYAGKADTIIWPECAIPIPYRADYPLAESFRKVISRMGAQMLMGTLDYTPDKKLTNGVLLIQPGGEIAGKYDKYHRVPFGEYVPFRQWIPESWVKAFDMGRDLSAGTSMKPLTVKDGVVAGTAVCYEGVFSYLINGFARNGANVLTAVSNDVWYPESSEPEQHLANAVLRCVETGLPMIRCGNNGGSGVVTKKGVFTQYIGQKATRPELLREKASGTVEVTLERNPEKTLAVRFENFFIVLLAVVLLAANIPLFVPQRRRRHNARKPQQVY